ncbi:MAG: hypothetical protein Q9227_008547 [Pyrenula ochraceoflavens]
MAQLLLLHKQYQEPVTVPKQQLTAVQSCELVQILLATCVGTILYERGLRQEFYHGRRCLWARCADDLLIDDRCSDYETYALGESCCRLAADETRFWTLDHNSEDTAVSHVTHLLKTGVFEALLTRAVRSVHFFVSAKSRGPLRILESYTFKLSHDEIDLEFRNDSLPDAFVTKEIDPLGYRASFESFMTDLCADMAKMTPLPRQSSLDSYLRLTDPSIQGKRLLGLLMFETDDVKFVNLVAGKEREAYDSYIHPFAKISHHYEPVIEGWTIGERRRRCRQREADLERAGTFKVVGTSDANGTRITRIGYYTESAKPRKNKEPRVSYSQEMAESDLSDKL